MQNTLGDTTHGPALQPTVSMRCHCDYVATTEDSCPFGIFAVLRHPDDARCDIVINGVLGLVWWRLVAVEIAGSSEENHLAHLLTPHV
ncbi:MAG: hypothetical protein ACJ8BW_38535 [Ktedonobacteraceae bacterium]